MAINALTISGPIAGEHAIIVQDNGDTVMVHHGSVSMGLRKETLDAYRSDYAGLVSSR